jgi:hypothetical protein
MWRASLRCVGILLDLKDSTKALFSLGVSLMANYSTVPYSFWEAKYDGADSCNRTAV